MSKYDCNKRTVQDLESRERYVWLHPTELKNLQVNQKLSLSHFRMYMFLLSVFTLAISNMHNMYICMNLYLIDAAYITQYELVY